MNIRFFNNMAVSIKTEEEIIGNRPRLPVDRNLCFYIIFVPTESVKAIGDTFEVASQMIGCEVEIFNGKLEKMRNAKKAPMGNPLNIL